VGNRNLKNKMTIIFSILFLFI